MARNTAQQGATFERAVIHHLEGCASYPKPCTASTHRDWTGFGYDCIRSAASKGKVDIVAVGPDEGLNTDWIIEPGGPVLFIQCKRTDPMITPAERLGIQDLALRAGALPIVAHWAKDKTTKLMRVHYRVLTGPGPGDWEPWAPGEET